MSEPDGATDQSTDEDNEGSSILDGGVDTDERAGRSLGIDTESEPDEETKQDMEEERERRLDPDNRPDGAEIDNTDRTFDVDRGMFTDNDDYDESGDAEYADPEDPNSDAGPDRGADGDAEPDTEPDDAPEDVQRQEEERS